MIASTVRSVLEQDYPNVEYLVVDGCSSDGTLQEVKAVDKANRVVIHSAQDNGISEAMNKGVMLSKGDLIIHLHAGDAFVNENVLSMVVADYRLNGWRWAVGGIQRVAPDGRILAIQQPVKYDYKYLSRICYLPHQATFITRDIFERYGLFSCDFAIAMDYEYWLRIGKEEEAHILPFVVSRFLEGGLSSDPLRNWKEDVKARRTHIKPYPLTLRMWDLWVLLYRYCDYVSRRTIPVTLREQLLQIKRAIFSRAHEQFYVMKRTRGGEL
jgi:glycosyltransferase involved in cell wall biosynthesis